MKFLLTVSSLSAALVPLSGTAATYAPWLSQIGISDSILSAASWGKGQVLGVVDTGIAPANQAFAAGQVSQALSSCAAVNFRCSNGFMDDNSHGTAVAAIAAANRVSPFTVNTGGYKVTAGSVIGVAPNANIVAEKVLNAAGSGYSNDVANGLKKAADAGASVINLSLTFGNSSDLVAAINYAASKGAFIVWAGGNSAQTLLNGANTTGLTAAAISHLVLAGSVAPNNSKSSFSNTPGAGSLVDTTNSKTSYMTRWIVAPGESILAPSVTSGANAWGAWSGTSMAAPVVSGSLMLLQSAWPILKTNGTTANLLLATATDLGSKGADASFGSGLVNLATAFQPYGTLTVTQANGKAIPVSGLTGSLISGGALGPLASVQSKLTSYTAFDGYARNFTVNLSNLIKSSSGTVSLNPLPSNSNTGPVTMKLDDGGELAVMRMETSIADAGFGAGNNEQKRAIGYATLTDRDGATTGFGYGFSSRYAQARALYGNSELAVLSHSLDSTTPAAYAQGGGLYAFGSGLNGNTRYAVSWSGTPLRNAEGIASLQPAWASPEANQISFGISRVMDGRLTLGATLGVLNEKHGLLGNTYEVESAVSFGGAHVSQHLTLSLGYALSRNSTLLLEAGLAHTPGSSASGLISDISSLDARSFGATWASRSFWHKDDRLSLTFQQPLRVNAGSATLVTPQVDSTTGVASFSRERVSLVPTGRELDFRLTYDVPVSPDSRLSFQTSLRRDVSHVEGNHDASLGMNWAKRF